MVLPEDVHSVSVETPNQKINLKMMKCPSWAEGMGRDRIGLFTQVRVEDVEFVFRWIPPGHFIMGSPENEPERLDREGHQHRVKFNTGFWLADTACTQALWLAVMGENPSHFKGDDLPVERVSWKDVKKFITRLNDRAPDGLDARLPSESEWEYACRAGTTTSFWFGTELTTDLANYNGDTPYDDGPRGEYREKTLPVRSFDPNPWGLYQMHGNVWEWCRDTWHDNYEGAPEDGSAWEPGDTADRVCRGGSWFNRGRWLRSAYRHLRRPDVRYVNLGFRLARGPQ